MAGRTNRYDAAEKKQIAKTTLDLYHKFEILGKNHFSETCQASRHESITAPMNSRIVVAKNTLVSGLSSGHCSTAWHDCHAVICRLSNDRPTNSKGRLRNFQPIIRKTNSKYEKNLLGE
jgi:hypothetical protein